MTPFIGQQVFGRFNERLIVTSFDADTVTLETANLRMPKAMTRDELDNFSAQSERRVWPNGLIKDHFEVVDMFDGEGNLIGTEKRVFYYKDSPGTMLSASVAEWDTLKISI